MQPKPKNWLERFKRFEPTILVRNTGAALRIASALGWITYSTAQIGVLEAQLGIIVPTLFSLLTEIISWLMSVWLRSKVASPATAETLALAVHNVERARAIKAPVRVSLEATRAAARVLNQPEPTPQHATRINNPL